MHADFQTASNSKVVEILESVLKLLKVAHSKNIFTRCRTYEVITYSFSYRYMSR